MYSCGLASALRKAVLPTLAAVLLAACACLPDAEPVAEAPAVASRQAAFGVLASLAGKTWRSAPTREGEAGPADISSWGWDLGGRVMINRHALEDGSYGGVTYVYENGETGSLDYVYVTSAGFHTAGSFVLGEDGSWTTEEAVTGHDTITRVRSTGRITEDGRMTMTSEYFANAEWSPGRDVVYETVDAEVPEIIGQPGG